MVPSASPRWIRLTGRVANCLFSAKVWPTMPPSDTTMAGLAPPKRLGAGQHERIALRELVAPEGSRGGVRNACMSRHRTSFGTRPAVKAGKIVARDDLSDDGDGNTDAIRLFAEAVETPLRHGAENFVIVAAGHEPIAAVPAEGSRPCGPPPRGDPVEVDDGRCAARAHHLGRSPASPSETSIAALRMAPQGDRRDGAGAADADSGRRDARAQLRDSPAAQSGR